MDVVIIRSAPVADSLPSTVTADDPTLDALDTLADVLEEVARDQELLVQRALLLRNFRAQGTGWRELLTTEPGEGSLQAVSQLLARVSEVSGVLRRVVVEELRREGVSIPDIAKLLGVSHQRVSNLLSPSRMELSPPRTALHISRG
jgi:DNA-directed RNA polymerase specialized sigma24 family protein